MFQTWSNRIKIHMSTHTHTYILLLILFNISCIHTEYSSKIKSNRTSSFYSSHCKSKIQPTRQFLTIASYPQHISSSSKTTDTNRRRMHPSYQIRLVLKRLSVSFTTEKRAPWSYAPIRFFQVQILTVHSFSYEDLKKIFGRYGRIVDITLPLDYYTRDAKGKQTFLSLKQFLICFFFNFRLRFCWIWGESWCG